MELPFTAEEFFAVFARYNRAFGPVVAMWWLGTIGVLAMVSRQPERWSPRLSHFLAVLWLWNAVAYHAWLFTRINPAAWLFAALFAVQAAVLARSALRREMVYVTSSGAFNIIGVGLTVYSLAYPFLTLALGHRYPATPTCGLPCPTVILTIGVLLTADERVPLGLAMVPIVWGFIGGSAAALLGVQTDYALFAAGVLLLTAVVAQRVRPVVRSAGI